MTERAMPEGDLREAIAKAALDEAAYDALGDGWVDAKRIPEGVDPDDWACELVTWDQANDEWRENGYRIADKILAVLRPHLGLGVNDRVIRRAAEFIDHKARRMTDDHHEERSEALRLVDEPPAIAGRGEVGGE